MRRTSCGTQNGLSRDVSTEQDVRPHAARKFCGDSGCRSTERCVCWDLERPGDGRDDRLPFQVLDPTAGTRQQQGVLSSQCISRSRQPCVCCRPKLHELLLFCVSSEAKRQCREIDNDGKTTRRLDKCEEVPEGHAGVLRLLGVWRKSIPTASFLCLLLSLANSTETAARTVGLHVHTVSWVQQRSSSPLQHQPTQPTSKM